MGKIFLLLLKLFTEHLLWTLFPGLQVLFLSFTSCKTPWKELKSILNFLLKVLVFRGHLRKATQKLSSTLMMLRPSEAPCSLKWAVPTSPIRCIRSEERRVGKECRYRV